MGKGFSRKRGLTCQQVEAQLVAYLKGGLSSARRAAMRDHLTTCDVCAQSLREAETLEAELYTQAAHHRPTLSPQASARIQEWIYRRMRRGLIMQRVTQVTWRVVSLVAILALAVGLFALWLWFPQEGEETTGQGGKTDGDHRDQSSAPTITAMTPAAGAEQITVRFAVYDGDQGRYQDLLETFQENNPGIKIKLVSIDEILGLGGESRQWPDDAWMRLISSADVIKPQSFDPEVEPGLARDLTPLIKADPTFDLDDFYPGPLASCQRDGGTWCLPAVTGLNLIVFDKDAFDAAGVPYPEPGWTWDDFLDIATQLTEREGDEVSRWGFVLYSSFHQPFIENLARPLIDVTTDPPTPRFDQPEVMAAVRWYTDLDLEHQVTPLFTLEEWQQRQQAALVDEGKAAMWDVPYDTWRQLSQGRNVGVVPFPGDTRIWARDRAAIMSAGTAHPEAAWRWLKALDQHVIDTYGQQWLPARRSVAEANGYWDAADEELTIALRYAVEHSYGARWSTGYIGYLSEPGHSALFQAIDAVLSGEKPVEDALAEAQAQAEADLLAEAARPPAPDVVVASPEDEPQASPDAVTILFASGSFSAVSPNSLQPYRDLAQAFQETHPHIIVEPKLPGSRSQTSMKDMAKDVDCFSWAPTFDEPGSLDAILSLNSFVDADLTFTTDDFYPSLLQPFIQEGQLWGLPGQARPEVILYNKDLFDAAGVDYPAPDWTTDDFLETVIALTQGEGEEKQYGFVGGILDYYELMWALERRGAKLIDESVDPPTVAFDDQSTIEALRWYADLSTLYGVKPVFGTDIAELIESVSTVFAERDMLIQDGRAAMWTILESLELVMDHGALNVGVASIPAGPGAAAGAYQSVSGYFISAHTESPQACWEWITYLTGQPEAVWGVPARRSVVQSEAYRQLVGVDRAAVYEASVAGADHPPSFQFSYTQSWLAAAVLWLGQAHGQVIEGEASVEEALAAAQQMFDDYRACVIARDAVSDQKEMQACLIEADPTFPVFLFPTDDDD